MKSWCLMLLIPAVLGKTITPDVIGSVDADRNEFPWMLSFHYGQVPVGANHYCGAILVDESWALTAARCIDGSTQSITAGAHIRTLAELNGTQLAAVDRIVLHPGYCASCVEYPYDLAMLHLSPPIDTSVNHIAVATLPSSDIDLTGEVCTVSGWGRTSSGISQSDILRKATSTAMAIGDCRDVLSTREIWDYNVCFADENGAVGICDGDRGGPLHCETDEGLVVAGMASWWVNCVAPLQPDVFIRTGAFKSWIDGVIGSYKS